jgi:hypothetical protein
VQFVVVFVVVFVGFRLRRSETFPATFATSAATAPAATALLRKLAGFGIVPAARAGILKRVEAFLISRFVTFCIIPYRSAPPGGAISLSALPAQLFFFLQGTAVVRFAIFRFPDNRSRRPTQCFGDGVAR